MSATAASWVAAIAAVAGVTFAGYQTYLLRKTIDDQFQSNLQTSQIDACSEFVHAATEVRSSISVWLANVKNEAWTQSESVFVEEKDLRLSYLSSSVELRPKAKKLAFFSGDSTASAIKSMTSSDLAFYFFLDSEEARSNENVEAWFAQFDEAFDEVNNACRAVLEGTKLGLL